MSFTKQLSTVFILSNKKIFKENQPTLFSYKSYLRFERKSNDHFDIKTYYPFLILEYF